jgi:prepilin peptidase CpaA
MQIGNALLGLALVLTALAALFDLRTGQIPNRLTLGGLALGGVLQLSAACWERSEVSALTFGFVGMALLRVVFGLVVCGLVPYLLFLRAGMGGGDVKLLAGLGALLGPVVGLEVQLYAFVVMAAFAPVRLLYEGRLRQVLQNSITLLANPLRAKEQRRALPEELLYSLKFAPAIFVATLVVGLLRWRTA